MSDQIDTETPHRPRRWLVAAVTTLPAWFVAFLVVMALLTLFRTQLASLPVELRALVISGVLVTLMVNVIMPVLGGAVVRMLAGRTWPRPAWRREPSIRGQQSQLSDAPTGAGTARVAAVRAHRLDRGRPGETRQ
jgi:hypothetical protein